LLPVAAAIALAANTVTGLANGAELAPILAASGIVYLGAAAFQRPATAWPIFLVAFVVVVVNMEAGGPNAVWILLGLAVLLIGFGLARGAARPPYGLPLQALAMAVVGAAAAITLSINETAGGYLVAAGLLGHAAWDVYHHRIDRVVVRSMAEFCFVIDTLLAIGLLVVVARG
jgi:hypothetical protein